MACVKSMVYTRMPHPDYAGMPLGGRRKNFAF